MMGIVAASGIGLGLANHACYELILLAEEPTEPKAFVVPTVFDECAIDEDCGLMPSLVTCCGECEPTPPFEPVPRSELAVLRGDCFPRERICDPPVCTPKLLGCEARAICKSGMCTVVANQQCLVRTRSAP